MPNPTFDLSLLPPAQVQFAVISDTHYMLHPGDAPIEFASRCHQTRRAAAALQLAAGLDIDFAVHLGDLVQEYPDTPDFSRAIDEALSQLRASGLQPRYVAGNHDVGDKTDPTMPTHPVTYRGLAEYHRRLGRSWYGFDVGPIRAIILNSQIMNTPLGAEQRAWLLDELSRHGSKRLIVFLHLPPYLWDPTEPHRGHYDNLGEPDRTWLLELLVQYRAERLFAGHVHFAFCDRLGPVRYAIAPSTSFTRPGFGHLFSSAPAPEQGRDDTPKLGFYLCRVCEDRSDLHLIRTEGATEFGETKLVTRTPAALQGAPLGVTLTHTLCPSAEVPLAWPSAIRQRVRNDYPFLALQELGATAARAPWTDIEDPLQRDRLQQLRAEGIAIQVFAPLDDGLDLHRLLDQYPHCADSWEVQTAGTAVPTDAQLDLIGDCTRRTPMSLSTIIPGERIAGKQLPRTRMGFRAEELAALNGALAARDQRLDSVLCRLGENPWAEIQRYRALPALSHIRSIGWLLTLPGRDDKTNTRLGCEALFAVALLPEARLYIDPPLDLDRTMDVAHGLLDAHCNPRPIFHALRCLQTVLHVCQATWSPEKRVEAGVPVLGLRSETSLLELVLPDEPVAWTNAGRRLCHLTRGTVLDDPSPTLIDGPALLGEWS